ncbi:uncharacterized protein LOC122615710 isoform X3 [Drosophila teissieri]|nr:uncharacterized protein LOC122615710 isoform X3 [Drosophila teissieri]
MLASLCLSYSVLLGSPLPVWSYIIIEAVYLIYIIIYASITCALKVNMYVSYGLTCSILYWMVIIITSANHKQGFPICGNCTNIENVHINTGFTCHFEDERQVENKFGERDDEYAHCVPKDYIINGSFKSHCLDTGPNLDLPITGEVKNYCCFWSPNWGCSALIGRHLFDKSSDYCDTCRGSCSELKYSDDEKSGGSNKVAEYGYIMPLLICELWIW